MIVKTETALKIQKPKIMKNMKKLFTLATLVLFANVLFADDGNEIKNFRFGLKVTPSINWYKPEGKLLEKNGVAPRFGGGLIMEFRLAKVAALQTGIQIDMDGGKIKYKNGGYNTANANTAYYYYDNTEDKIEKFGLTPPSDSASLYKFNQKYTLYQLNERTYKATYVTIPLMLKLKTKEIGMMTYFGQFGVNNSFRWSVKADDKLTTIKNGATDSKSKVNITKDCSFYTATLNFGAGVEMNLSGSTSVLIGVNYNLGFTNVVKSKSDYLGKRTNDALGVGTLTNLPQTLKSNGVVLTIGVLF